MRKRFVMKLLGNQRGFTLIELLVVVAILGTISSALTGVIFSIFHTTDDNNGRVEAVTGIEIAAQQMSEDGMSAQEYCIKVGTETDNKGEIEIWECRPEAVGKTGTGIRLTWITPVQEGGNVYSVAYKLSGTNLQRECTIDGELATVKVLAEDVTGLKFTGQDSNVFVLAITSTGGGSRIAETREYDVKLRADG